MNKFLNKRIARLERLLINRRPINEDMNIDDDAICVVYRDNIGEVSVVIDRQYGISFDGSYAHFDVDSETLKVPVKDLIYIGNPED